MCKYRIEVARSIEEFIEWVRKLSERGTLLLYKAGKDISYRDGVSPEEFLYYLKNEEQDLVALRFFSGEADLKWRSDYGFRVIPDENGDWIMIESDEERYIWGEREGGKRQSIPVKGRVLKRGLSRFFSFIKE